MQREVFEVLAEAKSLEDLQRIESKAREVYDRYLEGLGSATRRGAGHPSQVGRLNYSSRCAEASAVQAHKKQGLPLASGMEISYVIKDAHKW